MASDTAKVFFTGRSQAVRLPKAYRFDCELVRIRRDGESVILEPVKAKRWPTGFFDRIRIEDRGFSRPAQGPLPPAPTFE